MVDPVQASIKAKPSGELPFTNVPYSVSTTVDPPTPDATSASSQSVS